MIAAVAVLTVSAENYGIKVGGVEVTSSNCNNVAGGNIEKWDDRYSSYVKYNPSTKTLTLKNIWMDIDGNERAIYNYGCEGLTIVLQENNSLLGYSVCPVKIDKNTTVKTRYPIVFGGEVGNSVSGKNDAGAFFICDGATLTLDSAVIDMSGGISGCTIEGKSGNEKVVVKNSELTVSSPGYKDGVYAMKDIQNLSVSNSKIEFTIQKDRSPINHLKSFTLSGIDTKVMPKNVDGSYKDLSFSSSKQTFTYSDGTEATRSLRIAKAVTLDASHFPDQEFRTFIGNTASGTETIGADGQLEYGALDFWFQQDEAMGVTEVQLSNTTTSLKGIEYLEYLEKLVCSSNRISSLDLTANKKLEYVSLPGGLLTSLTLPATIKELACSNNQLATLDLSMCPDIKTIDCSNNALTSLNLPTRAPLTFLQCQNNRLTSLKMPNAPVESLYCYCNKIKGEALTEFINSMPKISERQYFIRLVDHISKNEENECTDQHIALAEGRGWRLQHLPYVGAVWCSTPNACYNNNLWISGRHILSHYEKDSGYEYNPESKTLSMNNFVFNGTGDASDANHAYGRAIQSGIDGLTIEVKGNVYANAADENCIGVMLSGNTSIVGYGNFVAKGGKVAIQAYNSDLTIGGNVTVKGEGVNCGINAGGASSGTLTVKDNAIVMATNNNSDRSGIEGFSALRMEDNHSIMTPIGAYWDNEKIVDRYGQPLAGEWVTIGVLHKGDVNRDGSVNTADVVAIYSYIENGETTSGIPQEDANVNGDSSVNTADVVKVYDIIINGEE